MVEVGCNTEESLELIRRRQELFNTSMVQLETINAAVLRDEPTRHAKATALRADIMKKQFRVPRFDQYCEVCEKELLNVTVSQYERHVKSHEKEKSQRKEKVTYKCENCGKEFKNNKFNYEKHQSKCLRDKPEVKTVKTDIKVQCDICKKVLTTNQANINLHIKSCKRKKFEKENKEKEAKEKVYTCELCTRQVKGTLNFERHMKKCKLESGAEQEKKAKEVKVVKKLRVVKKCEFCGKCWCHMDNYRAHRIDCEKRNSKKNKENIVEKHIVKNNEFKCFVCENIFNSFADLNSHNVIHHTIDTNRHTTRGTTIED